MTKSDVLKNPINFLYVFSNNKFEALVAKYISKNAAQTIYKKRFNQVKCISLAYNGDDNLTTAYADLSNAIQEQFGYTPQAILNKLLAGETVAGKNWKEGVYGVGATKPTTYANNSNLTVDTNTGKILQDGVELSGGTPIYKNTGGKTKISGYSYTTEEGTVYTTNKALTGGYYASTYGTSNGMFNASGEAITASDTSSVWECIATISEWVIKLIEWICSLFKKENNTTYITSANTVPAQTEFLTDTKESSVSLSSVGIIGAALIGGYLLMGSGSKHNKKK